MLATGSWNVGSMAASYNSGPQWERATLATGSWNVGSRAAPRSRREFFGDGTVERPSSTLCARIAAKSAFGSVR